MEAGLAFGRAGGSIVAVYIASVILFVPSFLRERTKVDEVSMRVTVVKGGPADAAGIRDGDRIVGVNGDAPKDWDHLKKLVAAHPDETIEVQIEREGARRKMP